MQQIIHRAADRGIKDIGWLKSHFSFSFSNYYHPGKQGFGLLKVFNDDVVQAGGGFGLHPHMNMEIISVMLQGKMNHKDTMGYSEEVIEDWVQIMSAGTGLRHEEHNIGDDEVQFLQIWIEPKLQNIQPRYQRRYFPKAKRRNQLVTIVSNEEGQAHCWINQNAKLSIGLFDAGQQVTYTFPPVNKCVYVFVVSGALSIGDATLQAKDALGIWDTTKFDIQIEQEASFIVIEIPVNH